MSMSWPIFEALKRIIGKSVFEVSSFWHACLFVHVTLLSLQWCCVDLNVHDKVIGAHLHSCSRTGLANLMHAGVFSPVLPHKEVVDQQVICNGKSITSCPNMVYNSLTRGIGELSMYINVLQTKAKALKASNGSFCINLFCFSSLICNSSLAFFWEAITNFLQTVQKSMNMQVFQCNDKFTNLLALGIC